MDLQKSTKLSGLLSAGELVSKSNSLIREFLLTNASAGGHNFYVRVQLLGISQDANLA